MRPDSSHCLRLRPDASGKRVRSLAERVAASLTAKHGQRLPAEKPEGAEEADAKGESGGGADTPYERDERAAPAHVERPVQDAPGQRSGQRGAPQPRRRAEERVLHGEDASHEAAGSPGAFRITLW